LTPCFTIALAADNNDSSADLSAIPAETKCIDLIRTVELTQPSEKDKKSSNLNKQSVVYNANFYGEIKLRAIKFYF